MSNPIAGQVTKHRATARRIRVMAAILALVALAGLAQQVAAQPKSQRDLLRRLAQSGNDAASVAFRAGRDYLDDQQWSKAEQKLNEYLAAYPSDRNVDQALYWLAYSQLKLEQYRASQKTLSSLFARYPNSTWARDGRTLWVRIPDAPPLAPSDNESDDFKIAVLQALFQADVARGIAAATDFLKPGSTASVRLKIAALSLLAHHGGPQVTPIILGVATNETDPKVRIRAIAALAATKDESVIGPLRDFALNSQDSDVVEAAVYALAQHSSPQALTVLGEIAMSNKSPSLRRRAIASIASRQGEPAVDQLLRIYDADQTLEIRKTVIAGLANRRSPRAGAKLLEIAKGADNVELRKAAINGIARRNPEQALEILLELYDNEKNEDLKDQIIGALSSSNDKRVTQKLIAIARNPQAPIERRKRAIGWLSRSKDPEVLKFLEDLLK